MFSCSQGRFATPVAIAGCAILGSVVSLSGQHSSGCDSAGELATLVETVADRATRIPLTGAVLTANWQRDGDHQIRARTDSAGQALICAPPGRPIKLSVAYHDLRTSGTRVILTLARPTLHTYAIDAPSVFVRGSVIDQETGSPVPSVAVRIVNSPLLAMTDNDGKFFFERIPVGDYKLHVEHISYAMIAAVLEVRDEDLDATIRLTPAAIPLEPITVTAFSRRLERVGFYERRKRGVGTFIGRKQIDDMNVQNASDLLRAVPSMRLIPQAPHRNSPQNVTLGRGNCRFRFIIDGARTLPDFEMDFVAASAIEGVEVYNGLAAVPALFRAISDGRGGATCGVIAVWTRDSR